MQKLSEHKLEEIGYKAFGGFFGMKVIVRSSLDVSFDDGGNIADTTRLDESLPLIDELRKQADQTIILGHLGRPEKRDEKYSLKPVQKYFEGKLEERVTLVDDFRDPHQFAEYDPAVKDCRIFLVENIRFYKEEESEDDQVRDRFSRELASLADVYINDSFASYRKAASTYDIATHIKPYIGPSYMKEISALSKLSEPQKPYVALLGGAKLSEKVEFIGTLAEYADQLLIGGALSYTLLKADGKAIGKSLIEEDKIEIAKDILAKHREKIVLPEDHLCVNEFKEPENRGGYKPIGSQEIPDDLMAVDIGLKTIIKYKKILEGAKTILWNGPMGVFEWEGAAEGTKELMQTVVKNENAFTATGGGDSLSAIAKFKTTGFNHVSTGGGAMLSFISKGKFPTLDIIMQQH